MRRAIVLSLAAMTAFEGSALVAIYAATRPIPPGSAAQALAAHGGVDSAVAAFPTAPALVDVTTIPTTPAPVPPAPTLTMTIQGGFGGPTDEPGEPRTISTARARPRVVAYSAPIVPLPPDPDERVAALIDLRAQRKAALIERLNQRAR